MMEMYILLILKKKTRLDMVAHTCDPSHVGGKGREFEASLDKKLARPTPPQSQQISCVWWFTSVTPAM
jgi:hypothetical protein